MKDKMDYFNEDFLGMNDQTSEIIGIFVSGESKDKVHDIMTRIADEANAEHRNKCDHDDNCRGTSPYLLAALKRQFLYHEMTEMERLALVANAVYSLGVRTGEFLGEMPKPPSFKDFMRMMQRGEQDG